MSDDARIEDLRSQIRRSGRAAARLRWALLAVLIAILVAGLSCAIIVGRHTTTVVIPQDDGTILIGQPLDSGTKFMIAAAFLLGGGVASLPLALLGVSLFRGVRVRQLRRALAKLPYSSRAEVLLPLMKEAHADTRCIAAPLVAELPHSVTEIVPASTPAGRGDEPIPGAAGQSHPPSKTGGREPDVSRPA